MAQDVSTEAEARDQTGDQTGEAPRTDEETPEALSETKGVDDPPKAGKAEPAQPDEIRPDEIRVVKKNAFFPVFLGGIVAAGIGFTAAKTQILDPLLPASWRMASQVEVQNLSGRIDAQSQDLSALDGKVAGMGAPDLSGVESAIADNAAALSITQKKLAAVAADLGGLDSRLTILEKRPITEGVSKSAIAAYERELQALQDSVAQQRSEIETLLTDARTMEQNAEMTAQDALSRAALTRVLSAIDHGGSFDAALNDLAATSGIEPPAALQAVAQSGVIQLSQLQDRFPDAARAALSAARLAEPDAEHGIMSFLQRQLGARSVAPREGSDPDAVLSRAEAALKEGRLYDTLAEIETLPPEALAAMSDWVSLAQTRKAAQDAAEMLAQSLNSN